MISKFQTFFAFIGDLAVLYGSLSLSLYLRYGKAGFSDAYNAHLIPFSFIFLFWVIVFYIFDFYEIKSLKNSAAFLKNFSLALLTNGLIAIVFFYLLPFYGITPKTNLLIFAIVFAVLELLWRYLFNLMNTQLKSPEKVLLINYGEKNGLAEELTAYLKANPQIGYEIAYQLKDANSYDTEGLSRLIQDNEIKTIVIPTHLQEKIRLSKLVYNNLSLGIDVMNFAEFYELVFKKVPLSELEEAWFLENLIKKAFFYDAFKNSLDFVFALLAFIVFLPFTILISVISKISSSGPVIYKQTRVGVKEKKFTLYKFRTMRVDAEKDGAKWAQQNDPRITRLGKILRYTHLDELPQLINVLKGELSFVGPRPERPEFVKELKEKIPYYEIRHLAKPGITGWAQINYRYGASVEDAFQKLQYEIYYLKNKSLFLDLLIILKTLKLFFINLK